MTNDQMKRSGVLRVAGLMSGTSADGVDVAIVDVSSRGVRLVAFETFAYPASIRRRLFALFDPARARVDELSALNFAMGEVFAEAVTKLADKRGIAIGSIDVIGSHGQTVYHDPGGRRVGGRRVRSTLQIGEPSVIAERTGITTVGDFRVRDVAAGGEGAPLVAYADYVLFSDRRKSRAVQNIGGIANVTFLPAGGGIEDVVAFDTGPGNMVIDRIAERVSGGRRRYDASGRMAGRGRVSEALLAELMAHRFFRRRPPKTTGREAFGAAFADDVYERGRGLGMSDADVLATVTALTARSISRAYRAFLRGAVDEVILCGGGAWNRTLVAMLEEELSPAVVLRTDDFGIGVDAKEAVSFAILAGETIRGCANNVPSATGAKRAVVLGKIVPGRRAVGFDVGC